MTDIQYRSELGWVALVCRLWLWVVRVADGDTPEWGEWGGVVPVLQPGAGVLWR